MMLCLRVPAASLNNTVTLGKSLLPDLSKGTHSVYRYRLWGIRTKKTALVFCVTRVEPL